MRGCHPLPLRSDCRLRGALRRAQEAFYATLDPITLDQIVTDPTGPVLLGISLRPPGAAQTPCPETTRRAARRNPGGRPSALPRRQPASHRSGPKTS